MSQHPFERRSHSDARYRQDASSISGSSSFHRNFYRQDGSYQRHPSEGIPSSSQQPYDAFSVRNAPSHIGEAYNQRYEQSVQARTSHQEVTQHNVVEKYKEIRQTYLLEKPDIESEISEARATIQTWHSDLDRQSKEIRTTIRTFERDPEHTDHRELERLETQLKEQISSYRHNFEEYIKSSYRFLQEKQDTFTTMDENFRKVMGVRWNNERFIDQKFCQAGYSIQELNAQQRDIRVILDQITEAHDTAQSIVREHANSLNRWDSRAANWDRRLHPNANPQQELPPPVYSYTEQRRPNEGRPLPLPPLPFPYGRR